MSCCRRIPISGPHEMFDVRRGACGIEEAVKERIPRFLVVPSLELSTELGIRLLYTFPVAEPWFPPWTPEWPNENSGLEYASCERKGRCQTGLNVIAKKVRLSQMQARSYAIGAYITLSMAVTARHRKRTHKCWLWKRKQQANDILTLDCTTRSLPLPRRLPIDRDLLVASIRWAA